MTPEETAAALAAKEQELETLKKEKEQKEKELSQAQHKILELKNSPKEDKVPAKNSDIDLESIEERLASRVKEGIEQFKLEQVKDTVEELISSVAKTEEEKNVIKEVYEKSIVKSGFSKESIAKDVQNAFIIANKEKLEKTISELQKTQISRMTQGAQAVSSQEITVDNPNLSDEEMKWVNEVSLRRGIPKENVIKQLVANRRK